MRSLPGDGLAEEIALHLNAPISDHFFKLGFCLDVLRGRRHPKCLAKVRYCPDDLARVAFLDIIDKGLVDLDFGERKPGYANTRPYSDHPGSRSDLAPAGLAGVRQRVMNWADPRDRDDRRIGDTFLDAVVMRGPGDPVNE